MLCGIPTVISTGALDMVNFGPYDTVPPQFADRNLYKHNPTVTLMRTTAEECEEIGKTIAGKINMSTGPVACMLPLGGVSMIDAPGQPFHGPAEDEALFNALRENIDPKRASIIEIDANINDDEFAIAAAKKLIELIEAQKDHE